MCTLLGYRSCFRRYQWDHGSLIVLGAVYNEDAAYLKTVDCHLYESKIPKNISWPAIRCSFHSTNKMNTLSPVEHF